MGLLGLVSVDISAVPTMLMVVGAFNGLGADIRSFRVPLHDSIQQVVSPSIGTNFDIGGRPAWAALAPGTQAQKQNDQILVETGRLERVAQQLNSWTINGPEGTAQMDQLSDDVYYGFIHEDGSMFMPAREWAILQPEDEDAIQDIFRKWLDKRITANLGAGS